MALWLRSHRYANRMIRAGRLLVVFRGEHAELPDWAIRERDWLVTRVPGVFAAAPPAAVFGVDVTATASEATRPPEAPAAAPPAPEEPARTRSTSRRGR